MSVASKAFVAPAVATIAPAVERRPARNTVVVGYIALAVVILLPGLALKIAPKFDLNFTQAGKLAAPLETLTVALAEIKFGSGPRFWLGVFGASIMATLLLYPLRKLFAKRRGLGKVGGWFQIHIVLGLMAPTAILYHCNFGLGSTNANVALWSMLIVVISGIAGHFLYGAASRDFYSSKQQALRHRDAILVALENLGSARTWHLNLMAEFEVFEAGLLTPRQGLLPCCKAIFKVEQFRRAVGYDITWHMNETARRLGASPQKYRQTRTIVGGHLRAYVRLARAAASQSLREQLWARWRLFHLPVFLVMVVAGVLHVIAVWGIEPPQDQSQFDISKPSQSAARDGAKGSPARPNLSRVPLTGNDPSSALNERVLEQPKAIEIAQAGQPPVLQQKIPTLAQLPQVVAPRRLPAELPAANSDLLTTKKVTSISVQPGQTQLTQPAPVPPVAVADTKPQTSTVNDALQRRLEMQPMALGGGGQLSLADQIIAFKAKIETKQFSHEQAETGFQLTGKHLKLDCISCHKQSLGGSPKPQPRQCVACHKTDDIHNGRRPDCASCHTTNRWAQILRRK